LTICAISIFHFTSSFFFQLPAHHRYLPSFPTRRSSDLIFRFYHHILIKALVNTPLNHHLFVWVCLRLKVLDIKRSRKSYVLVEMGHLKVYLTFVCEFHYILSIEKRLRN